MTYTYIEVDSPYPVRNRPVIVRPVADMSRKGRTDAGTRRLEESIRRILGEHPDGRVLVHSVSYSLTTELYHVCKRERQHVFTYRVGMERATAISDFIGTPGSVLVAPSADRGLDLKDDLCRAQIICKLPFPSLGDKQVAARLYSEGGAVWYNVQVARSLVQMVGRAVRGEDDWAKCYVLDSQFVKWNRMWGHLLPTWFSRSIRMEKV